MTTYPQDVDWIGKGWHAEPTPDTKYTVYKDHEGLVFLFTDRNEQEHALLTWANGGVTFQWSPVWSREGSRVFRGTIPEPLLKLVNSWLEYLDAVVEKEAL